MPTCLWLPKALKGLCGYRMPYASTDRLSMVTCPACLKIIESHKRT